MSKFRHIKLFRELAEPSSSSSLQAASGRDVGRGGVHHHQRGFEAFYRSRLDFVGRHNKCFYDLSPGPEFVAEGPGDAVGILWFG